MAVQTQMQIRRGTAASWTSTNPTLAAGEWGLETDTGKTKVGNGTTAWASLAYASITPGTVTAKGDLIVGTASGAVTNQAVGSNNQVLMADSAQADGVKWANEATATLTAKGDLLGASAANTLARIPVGSNGTALLADSTQSTGVTWGTPPNGIVSFLIPAGTSTASVAGTSTFAAGTYYISTFDNASNISSVDFGPNNTTSGNVTYTLSTAISSVTANLTRRWTTRLNLGYTPVNTLYATSKFVVAGGSAANIGVATSTDGITWTTRNAFLTTTAVRALAFGTIFVLAGNGMYLRTSTDGITWTSRGNISSPGDSPDAIIYGNSTYIMTVLQSGVGTSSTVRSTDGITWTSSATVTSQFQYGDGVYGTLFVLVGADGAIPAGRVFTSTDGLVWTTRDAFQGVNTVSSVAYGNSTYVVCLSNNAVNTIRTSTDAITWVTRANPFGTTGARYLEFVNGYFILTTTNGAQGAYVSTDGITWSARNNNGVIVGNGAAFGNNIYVIGGPSTSTIVTATGNNTLFGETQNNSRITVTPLTSVTMA